MAAKQPPQITHIETFLNPELALSHTQSQSQSPTDKPIYNLSNTKSKTHLNISLLVSFAVLLHAIYWEYTARSMDGFHHKWAHFQVSIAFSILNLLPSLSIFFNIYSPLISIVVVIHSLWILYHIFGSWIYDICSYNSFSEMCIAVKMY
eukprot:541765_1